MTTVEAAQRILLAEKAQEFLTDLHTYATPKDYTHRLMAFHLSAAITHRLVFERLLDPAPEDCPK